MLNIEDRVRVVKIEGEPELDWVIGAEGVIQAIGYGKHRNYVAMKNHAFAFFADDELEIIPDES